MTLRKLFFPKCEKKISNKSCILSEVKRLSFSSKTKVLVRKVELRLFVNFLQNYLYLVTNFFNTITIVIFDSFSYFSEHFEFN